ncbi:PD-(D/E)XK nuclease family protein [Deinococcus deserti]|uniref:Putative ATP-dependent nuclease, subunit B (AddB) n=1 Tax=Deinococcus deserti (strain DSM 17065 / CIP 109153 / LMG 22923 / VCD115) TaxID=546414 RepID=C1D2V9_DEIDV|nr:PD-(D/E)XK nuclease family protein [Deinococcus deserti]ACO47748.1 putative ATP-dependent nuclease, subunit B (AddB) [Deinococcus deserti VCD115]
MTRLLLTHPYPSVLLDGAAERYSPDLRLLVPNVQAGRDLRGRLSNSGPAMTLTQTARDLLRDAGWTPLNTGNREAFLRDVLSGLPLEYLDPLRDKPGTLLSLQRLLGELMRANIDAALLSEVAAPGRERDVARMFMALVQRSEAERTFDPVGAEFFAGRFAPVPARRMLVHGFAYLDASQVALLDRLLAPGSLVTLPFVDGARGLQRTGETLKALVARGLEVCHLQGKAIRSGDEVVAAYVHRSAAERAFRNEEFPDIESEVRSCLRQVRSWLDDGVRADHLAVIVRHEATYLAALADVAREYAVPLVSGGQLPLLHTPLGSLLQAWIDAHAREWRYSATRRVLTHPLLRLSVDALARARALQPGCPSGLGVWNADLDWLDVPEDTTWLEGLGVLQRLLVDLGVRDQCQHDPALNVAVSLLGDRLSAEARRTDACSREQLLGLVRHVLQTTTMPVLLGRGGVRVANPLAALGRRFDHVWVLGVSDTLFPARSADHPLIDSATRRRWSRSGVHVPDVSALASVEEALFLGAVAGAGHELVISRPRRGPDGRELRPSPFWSRLGEGKAEAAPLALGSEMERLLTLALAGQTLPGSIQGKVQVERERDAGHFGPHSGQLDSPIRVEERRWSPSQLHAAGACRYRWFTQKLLRLDEPLDPDLVEDRRVTGTLLHAALEAALQDRAAGDTTEDRVRRAEEALKRKERQLWASGELRGGPLWPVDREEIRRTAVRAVRSPAFVPPGWVPVHLEERREFTVRAGDATFALVGIVDRLDQTPDGLTVTDYKTGSYVSKVVFEGVMNLEVQLPLYMEALGAAGGRYLSIENAENLPEAAGPAAESPRKSYRWAQHQAKVSLFLENLATALAQGNVAPSPDHKREACAYCAVQPVCRDRGRVAEVGA